ncbi:hypothetical protein V6237_17965 [Pseudoalteromonas carrageenovora]|uniref:hypothetical protein n=1 Tax=Pseudoalteromonas carrageenovora TaxID=227 RepID=UPI00311EA65D
MISFSESEIFIIQSVFSIIAIFLVILGWVFLRKNASLFAKRSELNSSAKDMSEIINKIIDISEDYWLVHTAKCKYDNFVYESLIMNKIGRLLQKENNLKKYGVSLSAKSIIQLRQSLTLNQKDNTTLNKHIFSQILSTSSKLQNEIDQKVLTSNIGKINFFHEYVGLKGLLTGLIIVNTYLFFFLFF